jgi:hypothetical protein
MSSMCVQRSRGARLVKWTAAPRGAAFTARGALLALLLAGCARAPSPYAWPLDGGDDGGDPDSGASGEPCELGDDEPCDCDDGSLNGRRGCVQSSSSPQYGYFAACSGCRTPGDPDAGGNIDAGTPGADASLADAQQPDAQAQDARAPESGAADSGPSCSDGMKNGTETDIDCGGGCAGCATGKMCTAPADCAAGASCTGNVCTGASSPSFRNYDHASHTYTRTIDWSCAGTTRFDSTGSGSWPQTTACSNTDATRPEVTCGVAQTSAGGAQVCILRARGLTIAAGHTLELVGDKPVIIAVEGDATIAGIVSADANGATPGAGGNLSCGTSQGGDGSGNPGRFEGASGGGGGAFGSRGGTGGAADTDGNQRGGGAGGQARGTASLSPLLGGCAGGRAGGCQSAGGAGGGAVQIAASNALVVSGTVRANGGAGATPCGANDEGGGTGAGSGGGVLLQGGSSVNVAGATLSARGGNGGRNGAFAGIFNCGNSQGGAGATAATQDGQNGQSCQGGGAGAGGGHGRISTQ